MIKSLLARISATTVIVLFTGLLTTNFLSAQNDISGRICENDATMTNQDFSGVTVQLLDCTTGAILATDVTDSDGEYEFDNLTGSCYDINIVTPDNYCLVSGNTMVSLDPFDSDQVIPLVCFEEMAAVKGIAWIDEDGDGILDNEDGLGNVIVTLTGSGTSSTGSGTVSTFTASTFTNIDGTYQFDDLCPGTYNLVFATPTGHFITYNNAGGLTSGIDSEITPVSTAIGADGTTAVTLSPGECEENINAGYTECRGDLTELIDGTLTFCTADAPTTAVTYSIPELGNGTYSWTLSGGGTITGTPTGNAIQITWTGTTGTYNLDYTYTLGAAGDPVVCMGSFEINFVDAPASNVLACNNLVNLTLNTNCEVKVNPDVLLEGNIASDAGYTVELTDVEGDSIISSNCVGPEFANKILIAKVTNICTGNSCWGNVKVEDKNIPALNCADVTVSCGDDIAPVKSGVSSFNFVYPPTTNLDDILNANVNWPLQINGFATVLSNNCFTIESTGLCGESTLCYEDTVGSLDCEQPDFSQITTRKWTITTASGSSNTCTEEIKFRKPDLDMLDWPDHLIGDDALDCRFGVTTVDSIKGPNYWLILPNGNPDPASPNHDLSPTGLEANCQRLKTSYTDQRYGDCDGSYKLQRTWIVLDWCTSEIRDSVQIIEVAQRGEIVVNIPNQFTVDARYGCTDAFDAPAPNIIFPGCSAIKSIQVGYKLVLGSPGSVLETFTFTGVTKNADGTFRIPRVEGPGSRIWIGYVVMNECGQMTEGFTEADFVDAEEPVAVCDQETVVSLNAQGMAWASPSAFDDGSWDNCGISHLEVMKITGAECGEPRAFADKIKFCCEDVGEKVEVHVKVIDNVGLENTCKSWVEVQDNFAPVIKSCPTDRNVNCDIDPKNLSSYGSPEFDGVCEISITPDTIVNINDCGIGTIRRIWRGVNSKGTAKTCEQVLSVGRLNPFDENDITWPTDFESDGCFGGLDLDPRNLEASRGLPIISDVNCSNISFDYEDLVLQSDESCYKIIREWTVLDWCQYNADQSTGIFIHNQVIKLDDNEDPVITKGCGSIPVTHPLDDNCEVSVYIGAKATDNCTSYHDLKWSYVIRNTDTNEERSGNGNDLSGQYGIGNYRITWTVRDNCDNDASCSQTLNIVDTKAPTPFCLGDIVTVLNRSTKSVSVWASDFVTGSADNCGPKENNVTIAFSEDKSDTNITVDCSDFTSAVYEQKVKVYAIDDAGNFTFCEARLVVQNNHDLCTIEGEVHDSLCNVVGGYFLTVETDTTEITACIGDDISDAVIAKVWEEEGDTSTYIVTDVDGNILRVSDRARFEFEGTDLGTNFVYHVSSVGTITGLEVGLNTADITGCFELSNPITVNKVDKDQGGCDFNGEASDPTDDDSAHDTSSDESEDQTSSDETEDDASSDESAIIAGHIFTLDNKMIEGVEVHAYSDEAAYHQSLSTDEEGTFAFPELAMYKDYMLEASMSGDYSNGVSTLDIVIIQRHILGLKTLDSPHKIIAADANNSQSISASDLVLLRKLILGISEELPNNESWRFVDEDQEFEEANNPFPFREQIEYYDLQTSKMKADFVAIKVGDVNNTVSVNNLQSTEVRSGKRQLVVKAPIVQGDIMMVPFYKEESSTLAGMQFTLDLGRSISYKGISAKQINVTEANVGTPSSTELSFSWNTAGADLEVDAEEALFYLILQSEEASEDAIAAIQMNSTVTVAEVYESESEIYELELVHELEHNQSTLTGAFKLYQNVPNPFSDATTIGFYLPQPEQVTLRLIDITGKVVMSKTASFAKGKNQITVNSKEINTQGVLYYQLETESNIANMKMIVLK